MRSFSKIGHKPDYLLISTLFILIAFGLVILTSASSDLGKQQFNDSFYYLKHQIYTGLLVGAVGFFVASRVHYQSYRKVSLIFLLVTIALLVLVFTHFGIRSGGSNRWLRLGPLEFQPSELLKLTYIVYLAAWITSARANRKDLWEGVLPFFLISGIVGVLLLLQPATSVVVILMLAGFTMYLLSGAPIKYVLIASLIGVVLVGALVYATPYRRQRIMTFLHPSSDTQGAGFQVNQSMIAIGSGGFWGVGFGQSPNKFIIPEPVGDSIFAIAAQELGFVGAASLVTLFGILVVRLLWLGRRVRDQFGSLILVGFGLVIAFQSLVNIGAISGLLPLTGVPLPFVSYGGTALAIFMTMGGIAVNISKYS